MTSASVTAVGITNGTDGAITALTTNHVCSKFCERSTVVTVQPVAEASLHGKTDQGVIGISVTISTIIITVLAVCIVLLYQSKYGDL